MNNLDTDQLAHELSKLLIPLTPYLVKGLKISGKELAKALGKKVGDDIPTSIKTLWNKIFPKLREKPEAINTIEKAIKSPADSQLSSALENHIKDILADDTFRNEISSLLSNIEKDGIVLNQIIEVGLLEGEFTGIELNGENALDKDLKEVNQEIHIPVAKPGSKITGFTSSSSKNKDS